MLLGVVVLLAVALRPRAPVTIHPVAPPLTRISALGDSPIVPGAPPGDWIRALEATVQQVGSAEQRAALEVLHQEMNALRNHAEEGIAVRRRQQARAAEVAGVLGGDRLAAIVANKEALTAAVGEGRVWAVLAEE